MPDLPLVGTDFAGYRLRSVLGRGGMSIVYQAENPRLRNLIALKVLAPELASDQVFRTRFRAESQIAASLNHPNVIPIHDFGSYDNLLYIAMRYVAGTDLGRLLASRGWLAPGTAVFLLEQAARALDAAHSRGVVHRDVKPANLLIAHGDDAEPDYLYLADFGITKYVGAHSGLTVAGTVLGTVDYVSPEQIQEQAVFGSADQYSLACVLYECLTGRVPFERRSTSAIMWAHVNERPIPPSMLRPDLPPAIDAVIERGLAKDPGNRYASCREFIADAREAVAPSQWSQPQSYQARSYQAQSYQAAPLASGPFRPTPVGPRTPVPATASTAVLPGGATGAERSSFPGDFRGQFDFAGEPVRRRRVRRRGRGRRPDGRSVASLAAIGIAAAVIAGGSTVAGLVLTRTGDNTPASALYTALEGPSGTEHFTGMLPASSCAQRSATNVVCTNPVPAIESVSFVTYSSPVQLYTKYEEIVYNLTRQPFSSVENHGAICSATAPDPTGENSWNHSDGYTHSYTVQQLESGKVPDDTAMGRVFCQQTANGSEIMVWTQDSGHLLGYATGLASHEQVWNWFYYIHHSIIFNGMSMSDMPSMPAPASGTSTTP